MNDLIIVRVNDNMNKFGLKGRKYKPKNIQIYLNNLLNTDKYKLKIFGYEYIEVYRIDRSSGLFFGMITRSRNKKLFDKLYLTMRLRDE
jgi:hypothetical protein